MTSSSKKGFLLTRQVQDLPHSLQLTYWLKGDSGPVKLCVEHEKTIFFVENQSVELFEIRPTWKDSSVKMEQGIAKTTFVKKDESWKVFWQRSDLKWHRYEPMPTVRFFEEFLELIAEDEHACFFG